MISLPVRMQNALESGNVFEIELYKVELATITLYLCSCDTNITYNGQTYIGVPIERGEMTQSVDNTTDQCDLTIANTTEYFTKLLFEGLNFTGCMVYVYRIIYPDSLQFPNMVKSVFVGQIDAPELTTDGTFKVTLTKDMTQEKCGRVLQYACNSVFGDECCMHEVKEQSGEVVYVSNDGKTIGLSNFTADDNIWTNSILIINGEGRLVKEVLGANQCKIEYIYINTPQVGDTYTIKQGCDKTRKQCKTYGNLQHYNGFPSVPYEYQVLT